MSGLSASFNLNDPLYVQNTFYVDSKFGTAFPPAEGQRPDRAFLSGNDAISEAINHLNGGSEFAIVRFRTGIHRLYQRDHYCDKGALIIYTEPGALIEVVRDLPITDPTSSVITWDFGNHRGDAIVCGQGTWLWGQHPAQAGTGFPPLNGVFRVFPGNSVGSVLFLNELSRVYFEAFEFAASRNSSALTPVWYISIEDGAVEQLPMIVSVNRLSFMHAADEASFLRVRTTNDIAHVQIRSQYSMMGNAALVHNNFGVPPHISYYCPEHYGFNLTSNGGLVRLRLLGGTSIKDDTEYLNSASFSALNCSLSPGAGQSHIHLGSGPPDFGDYGEYINSVGSNAFAGGEILFTGFTPNLSQAWRNTLSWGESKACVEFDFSAYPIIGPTTVFSGFALEGQTLRGFDVRVVSPLTPGVQLRFGTSLSPGITGTVNTTVLNNQILTPTSINVVGSAYDFTSNFEQFAVTLVSGPNLTQGKIQLYPRLGGALKT